jgi:hypothetical protein
MKAIDILKSGLGYTWAVLCLVVVLATFVGLNFWANTLAQGTGIQVSPRYTGGEVQRSVDHGQYLTLLHRPVFDGLLGERSEGFVQIDWTPKDQQSLPALIEEEFDTDGDGTLEFSIRLDTVAVRADLIKMKPWVLSADSVITVDKEQILRVRLRNPRKSAL